MAYMDVGNLYQKYGLEQVVPMAGGEIVNDGDTREIDLKITLSSLTTTPTIITGTDNIVFPAGFRLEEVEVINDTTFTGGTSTLNVGLVRVADRSTEVDYDGILKVAPATGFDAAGEKTVYRTGVTGIGDLVGVTSGVYPAHFTAHYGTAVFAGGVVTVRVKFRKV